MGNTSISIQDKNTQKRASVVPLSSDPTKNGLVICNHDGSKVGNPFDYLQLKTDYTPTGSEPVGTIYWDSGFKWVQPDWVSKEFATKEYVDDTSFISSLLFG